MKIGIGLNTGMACVGNLGSDQRFSYSCLGDSVNLASRVEGMTKLYDVAILLTEEVVRQAPGFVFAEVDRVRVVGRRAAVRLYTLLGRESDPAVSDLAPILARHEAFLDLWQTGDLDACRRMVEALLSLAPNPLSGTHRLYRSRLETLPETAPDNWDGVFTAGSK